MQSSPWHTHRASGQRKRSTHASAGYGSSFDRSNVCFDSGASVVVTITDSCECNYPPNAYSNRRWCAGQRAVGFLSCCSHAA